VNFPGYTKFVVDKLNLVHVSGWGGYVLKEKLKMIKRNLKERHQNHSQNLDGKIKVMKDRVSSLDA